MKKNSKKFIKFNVNIFFLASAIFFNLNLKAEDCSSFNSPMEVSEESLKLLKAIKPIVGNTPAFCRDFEVSTDDEVDLALKKKLKN